MDIFQTKEKGRYNKASCTLDCGVHLLTVGTIKDKITWFIFSSAYFFLDRQARDWNASLYNEVFHERLRATCHLRNENIFVELPTWGPRELVNESTSTKLEEKKLTKFLRSSTQELCTSERKRKLCTRRLQRNFFL